MLAEQLQRIIMDALQEFKALDITSIKVSHLTSITDYMIICSGSSNRHVSSLANNVIERAKENGVLALGVEGQEQGEWALIDLADVVIHVMQPKVREFYALEKLWLEPATTISNSSTQ
jgi:ribosome-associated protein